MSSRTIAPELRVAEIMFEPVSVVERPAHLAAAAFLMQHAHSPALIVVDNQQSRRPEAIITARDMVRAIAHAVDAAEEQVAAWETPNPQSVHTQTLVSEAVDRMLETGYPALAVVDDAGRLVGMVDLFRYARGMRVAQSARHRG